MNALKIFRQIDSNDIHIDGLEKYKGKNAEIIILIDEGTRSDSESRRQTALSMIRSYAGTVQSWRRDELHER